MWVSIYLPVLERFVAGLKSCLNMGSFVPFRFSALPGSCSAWEKFLLSERITATVSGWRLNWSN